MSAQPVGPTDARDLLQDPHARLSASLILSLVLWIPFGMAALRNDLDVVEAGLRYLVAFVGCRLAVGGIAHLMASYHQLQHADGSDLPADDDAPMDRRRAEDAA